MTRVITGAVLVATSCGVILAAPEWLFWLLLLAVVLLAAAELGGLLGHAGLAPWPVLGTGCAAVIAIGFHPRAPQLGLALALAISLALVVMRALATDEPLDARVRRLGGTLLAAGYLGVSLGHVGAIFSSGGESGSGRSLLLFVIASVYVGDIAAYYGGRALGRRRLAPRISPAKTWEGAGAGICGSALGAGIASVWLLPDSAVPTAAAVGALLGAAGILGDLFESILKRAAAQKDSSALLPGHGGVLDRLDSLLLAAPLAFWIDRLGLLVR